jgi:TetR/AcrR family transcriptional regulator, tetracycline repressor protein
MRAVRAGGYQRMTIRSLAADLGVAPMSLYRHVRDKDDLLDEVVDRLLARTWRPRAVEEDWQAWLLEVADKLRQFLVSQPAALHVYLRHPVVSPAALERMQAMMQVLEDAGIVGEPALRVYAAIQSYTIGFAALEASRAGWVPPDGDVDDLAHQLAAYTSPRQFVEGLSYLLEAVERRADSSRGRRTCSSWPSSEAWAHSESCASCVAQSAATFPCNRGRSFYASALGVVIRSFSTRCTRSATSISDKAVRPTRVGSAESSAWGVAYGATAVR